MTPHETDSTGTPDTPRATAPPARTFGPQGPTLGDLSDAYLQDYQVRQFRSQRALLHESSRARTVPTHRMLTCRCDTTLVDRGRSSDSRSHSRGRPHSPARLDSGREGHRR